MRSAARHEGSAQAAAHECEAPPRRAIRNNIVVRARSRQHSRMRRGSTDAHVMAHGTRRLACRSPDMTRYWARNPISPMGLRTQHGVVLARCLQQYTGCLVADVCGVSCRGVLFMPRWSDRRLHAQGRRSFAMFPCVGEGVCLMRGVPEFAMQALLVVAWSLVLGGSWPRRTGTASIVGIAFCP